MVINRVRVLGSGPHTPTQLFWEYPPGDLVNYDIENDDLENDLLKNDELMSFISYFLNNAL